MLDALRFVVRIPFVVCFVAVWPLLVLIAFAQGESPLGAVREANEIVREVVRPLPPPPHREMP